MASQDVKYREMDKMAEIICENASLLKVMNRFGISLGFGDESLMQVCTRQGVDYKTFLAVINFVSQKQDHIAEKADVSVAALLDYLKRSHSYFLDFELPNMRRNLEEAIGGNHLGGLVLKFYDDYVNEVRKHMEYEEVEVFPFVEGLLSGKRGEKDKISTFSEHHTPVDEKLNDLKNIIIKYFPSVGCSDKINAVLYDIFSCEQELKSHCEIEDHLFVPAVMSLKKMLDNAGEEAVGAKESENTQDVLSQREKEIVICVVRGLTNKEIADKLFLSIHTVITHRRNISRKLQIHSAAGLAIYAIANKLIELDELK